LDAAAVQAEKQITDRLPSLIQNMLVLADGVRVTKTTSDGEEIVYSQPPDRGANEYLINRVMGKPTERQESDVDMNVSGGVHIFLPERKDA